MKIINHEQGSDEWHEERHGCVTGTKLESALGACFSVAKNEWQMGGITWGFDGDKLVRINEGKQTKASRDKQYTLMLEIVSDRQSELEIDEYCSDAMQRGNYLEPFSVKAACDKHDIYLEACGMLQSDTHDTFKFSPDAVCFDKTGVIIGGYETKSKAGKKHIEYQEKNTLPHEHLMQCLCPMILDDSVKWWMFGHFDDMNKINQLFTIGIKRADYEDFITVAREVLSKFLLEVDEMVERRGGAYNG